MTNRSRVHVVLLVVLSLGWLDLGVVHAVTTPVEVSVHGTQVSVTLVQATLGQVLEALAAQVSFTAHVAPSLIAAPISVTFTDLPLAKALERVLVGINYVWARDHVWVWPREASPHTGPLDVAPVTIVTERDPIAPTSPTVHDLTYEASHAPDPADRLTALEDLMDLEDEAEVVPSLLTALQDADSEIRAFALDSLDDLEETIPLTPVTDVALYDPEPEHRQEALEWLAEQDTDAVVPILEQALADRDDDVRSLAHTLLEQLRTERETAQLKGGSR